METQSRIDRLNKRFGVPGLTQIVAGDGGLPVVRIQSEAAAGEISLYGAHVTRWRPAGAEEVLFLSRKSFWQEGKAIRGGIPVCFPWFGEKSDDPKAPNHGFVRLKEWRLDSLNALQDGSVTLVCVTESDVHSRQWWPHDFCVAYRITMGLTLRLELTVINSGKVPMRYEEALHSYLRVADVHQTTIAGLDGRSYLDKTEQYKEKKQEGQLRFTGHTDRVYLKTREPAEVIDTSLKRLVRTEKVNSGTTVVWNPWIEQASRLADLGDGEWKQFVAVEGSNVLQSAPLLAPGEEHTLRVTLSTQAA